MSQYGMPAGVYVSDVTAGTGAAAAGLSKGCVITAIDGTAISSMEDLQDALKYYKAGEKVSVKIAIAGMSGYTEETVSVKLSTAKAAGIK
jgi:serine protease Do